jgi:hypothetical protein
MSLASIYASPLAAIPLTGAAVAARTAQNDAKARANPRIRRVFLFIQLPSPAKFLCGVQDYFANRAKNYTAASIRNIKEIVQTEGSRKVCGNCFIVYPRY